MAKEKVSYETIILADPKLPRSLEMWVPTEDFHNFKLTTSWIHQVEMAHKIVDVETQKVLKDKIVVLNKKNKPDAA